jgi:3-hydroxy acid dehydrogenase / malonic semialdehyde reductase
MLLKGKTVLVTGATSGFGLACAHMCKAQGAKLVLTGRRKERLDTLQSEGVHTVVLDVRDHAAVEHAVDSLPDAFSNVDVLVNNAGLALGTGSFETQTMEDLEQMVDTNIKGVIYCTQALLPGMIARGRGHIINIGSVAGVYPYPGGNVYGGTKAFVAQFSLNLRADLLGKNIRVTIIEPGMAETEFSLVRFHGDAQKSDEVYKGVDALSSQDVADAIVWCITRPAHVNINRMELMPTQQAFSPFAVERK